VDAISPRGRRLILIDDDEHLRRAMRFSFEAEGFAVTAFATGEAALQAAPFETDVCFVVDERLPGISGLETIARLRAGGMRAPAILITSHPALALRNAAAKAGVSIVEKPLLGDALTRKISELIEA